MSGKGVCYDCPDRWVTEESRCDAKCERRKQELEEQKRQREAERRMKAAEADADGFREASIRKTIRHIGGRRKGG